MTALARSRSASVALPLEPLAEGAGRRHPSQAQSPRRRSSSRRHPFPPLQEERAAPAVGPVQCAAEGRALVAAAARLIVVAGSTHSPPRVASPRRRRRPARGLRAAMALPPLEPLADSSRWSTLPRRSSRGGRWRAATISPLLGKRAAPAVGPVQCAADGRALVAAAARLHVVVAGCSTSSPAPCGLAP